MSAAQLPIDFSAPPAPVRFDGESYDAPRDRERLAGQLERVSAVCRDGEWRTLGDIARAVQRRFGGGLPPEASISARLRDLRKPRFGGYEVERRHRGAGLWEYRVRRDA